jgi:AcrR family transcriptional regulator
MLQEALLELTVEKGFAAVTVRDLCERAMVNRSTFYRHFLDKYALLDEYLDEVKVSISEAFERQKASKVREDLPMALVVMLQQIQSAPDFYRIMLGAQGDARFIQRFRKIIENHMRVMLADMPPEPNEPPLDLRLNYVSGADIGAILWWLESAPQSSVEDMARWISRISSTGLRMRHTVEQQEAK